MRGHPSRFHEEAGIRIPVTPAVGNILCALPRSAWLRKESGGIVEGSKQQ